jgi:hypothetical protein
MQHIKIYGVVIFSGTEKVKSVLVKPYVMLHFKPAHTLVQSFLSKKLNRFALNL